MSANSVNIDKINMPNRNFICDLTLVIPPLPCVFSMAEAVSSMVQLVNSVTVHSFTWFNFIMCAFSNKYCTIELVSCSDGW